jgi:hypothetical protein
VLFTHKFIQSRCCFIADPDYLAFVEHLEAQPEPLPSADAQAKEASALSEHAPQITALMAFLQEKHALRKNRGSVVSGAGTRGDASRVSRQPVRSRTLLSAILHTL